jgi:hypothetical protein
MFAVPFPNDRWGVILIARQWKSSRRPPHVVFVYGFDLCLSSPSIKVNELHVDICGAVYMQLASDLRAWDGTWTLIGKLPAFRPEDWPIPPQANEWGGGPPVRGEELFVLLTHENNDYSARSEEVFTDASGRMINYDDYVMLPKAFGLGDGGVIDKFFPKAVLDPMYYSRYQITPEKLEAWKRVTRRIRAFRGKEHEKMLKKLFGTSKPPED